MIKNMRKLLPFVIAIAGLGAGLYLLGAELLIAHGILWRVVGCGVVLVLFGGYLLWVDFIAPAVGIRTWEK